MARFNDGNEEHWSSRETQGLGLGGCSLFLCPGDETSLDAVHIHEGATSQRDDPPQTFERHRLARHASDSTMRQACRETSAWRTFQKPRRHVHPRTSSSSFHRDRKSVVVTPPPMNQSQRNESTRLFSERDARQVSSRWISSGSPTSLTGWSMGPTEAPRHELPIHCPSTLCPLSSQGSPRRARRLI